MKPVSPEQERAWILQLVKEFQDIQQYYRLNLPQPFIKLTDNTQQYGSWQPLLRTLSLSRVLIQEHSWDVTLEIFKHELAHLYVTEYGEESNPHGPAFQKACQRLGVAPWARSAQVEVDPTAAQQEHRQLSEEKERQLRRVEKLLSLAQSSNANEAALAMQRARELTLQHQLDGLKEQRNYTIRVIDHKKKTMPAHQNAIASILCTHFYVDCVSRSQYDAWAQDEHKVLEILGSVENVQIAEYVYWYLWNELKLLWKVYSDGHQTKGRRSQRSFFLGVLNGFHTKLSREKTEAKASDSNPADTSALLLREESLDRVLRSELRSFVNERYPRLSRGGVRSGDVQRDAYDSGRARGEALELRKGLENSGQTRALGPASDRS